MKLFKNEHEQGLDRLTGRADETLDLYRELRDHAAHERLAGLLDRVVQEQERLLAAVFDLRREKYGELPESGDPDRALVRAVWQRLKAAVSPDDDDHDERVVTTLMDASSELRQAIEDAVRCALGDDEVRLLTAYRDACTAFERDLRELDAT